MRSTASQVARSGNRHMVGTRRSVNPRSAKKSSARSGS